jgi:hypothetical protein
VRFSQTGVAVDAYGKVFATDSDSNRQGNHAVWEYTSTGQELHVWGDQGDRTGHFYFPQGIAVGPAGSIYVADTGNNRIQILQSRISPAPIPSGPIVLGSKAFTTNGTGWGTVKPSRIVNGGDPSGIVQGIHWQHWGQNTAFGWGSTFIFLPKGGCCSPVSAELRATDIGHCSGKGPLAYRRLSIRVPSRPGGPLGPWTSWRGFGICVY